MEVYFVIGKVVDGFGYECGVVVVEFCYCFNDVFEVYYVVGGFKGFVVVEIILCWVFLILWCRILGFRLRYGM